MGDKETKQDLCKSCKKYWVDFPLPLDTVIPHCEILDEKKGLSANMDEEIPYPCTKCPFNCYEKDAKKLDKQLKEK